MCLHKTKLENNGKDSNAVGKNFFLYVGHSEHELKIKLR